MSGLPSLLDQAEIWVDGSGREFLLDAMDRHHRANLIPFLRGNAITLWLAAHRHVAGRSCTMALAEEWLERTPLMRRLVELEAGRPIDERRETFDRNQAFEAETGYQKVRFG